MRITHVINDLKGGGAQNLVASLAQCQQELGHVVSVVAIDQPTTGYERYMEDRLRKCGVGVVTLGRCDGQGYSAWVTATARLSAALRNLAPDIINSHLEMSHSIVALARRTAKTGHRSQQVATIHNAPEVWGSGRFSPFVARRVFWHGLNRSTPRIYCSEAARQCEADWRGASVTVPNGVLRPQPPADLAEKRAEFRRQLGVSPEAALVVTVGSVRAEKNHGTAIRALSRARQQSSRPVHYVVCGRPWTGSAAVEEAIRETGSSDYVHLVGMRQDARDILFYADCYLSASLREGLPLAVLEALFTGLPCVLSDIKPHRDLAEHLPGCCLSANEPESLGKALHFALGESDVPQALRDQRELLLAEYTTQKCADRYLRFYESLLSSKHSTQPNGVLHRHINPQEN